MATNFPTSLDALTNPGPTQTLDSPSHSTQHANLNDAVEALEAKVGVNGSAVATSHDKILTLKANIASPTFTGTVTAPTFAGALTGTASNATTVDNGAITTAKLDTGAVTAAKIATGAVTSTEIALDAVTTTRIIDGAVTTAKIDNLAVTAAKIATGTITSIQLDSNCITNPKIATDAVQTSKILDGAVTNAKIGLLAVDTAQLAAGAVNNPKLADDAVQTSKIKNGVVTSPKIYKSISSFSGATYSVVSTDWVLSHTGTSSTTVTLPNAATYEGRPLHFRNTVAFTILSASTNITGLKSPSSGTTSTILSATDGAWCELVSNGTDWVITMSSENP